MPSLGWVIPCSIATVDRFTNAVSMANVIEEFQFPADTPDVDDPAKPLRAQGFVVVSHWLRNALDKPETATAKLVLIGPGLKKPLGNSEFTVDLSSHTRARQLSHMPAFPYIGPGDYFIEVHLRKGKRWQRVGRTWIEVKKDAPAQANP